MSAKNTRGTERDALEHVSLTERFWKATFWDWAAWPFARRAEASREAVGAPREEKKRAETKRMEESITDKKHQAGWKKEER